MRKLKSCGALQLQKACLTPQVKNVIDLAFVRVAWAPALRQRFLIGERQQWAEGRLSEFAFVEMSVSTQTRRSRAAAMGRAAAIMILLCGVLDCVGHLQPRAIKAITEDRVVVAD